VSVIRFARHRTTLLLADKPDSTLAEIGTTVAAQWSAISKKARAQYEAKAELLVSCGWIQCLQSPWQRSPRTRSCPSQNHEPGP
jgi:hypothetical protein